MTHSSPLANCSSALAGISAFHATPLHYLPSILADGAVYAKDVLRARGIRPRVTAFRRDRMLGLGEYVHFTFDALNPLYVDKLTKGYPHALLVFDAAVLATLPGAGLLPFNTKSWRSKQGFAPLTDSEEAVNWIRAHERGTRAPSLELLIKYGAGLDALKEIRFTTTDERDLVAAVAIAASLRLPAPLVVRRPPAQCYSMVPCDEIVAYYESCVAARAVLAPPDLLFD